MEKVMYALWRPESDLDDHAFARRLIHEIGPALTATGARGVRLHVIDADVAEGAAPAPAGLRRSTMTPPIAALASVWLDSALDQFRRPLDDVFTQHHTRFAGYLVSESAPLPHSAAPLGRTEGFSQVAFLRRPERLSREAWLERWHDHHTDVAIHTQSTFAYRQNLVVDALHDDAPRVDAIVEESFPMAALTDWHTFYNAVGDEARFRANVGAMVASTETFIDYETDLDVLATSEYVLTTPFI